ncbi:hypothetical protein E4U60_006532 [Claviceps pazoutovae]|uniref:tyrosinase n=1 Tax=Claviceps pazoutovae TaxID=1649127 RepID=A0A9P7MGH4_9HYPO|nr:hypothetical protein E4U60_006532 [Claviceps pazoutovae]
MILNTVAGLLAIGLAPMAVTAAHFPVTGVPVAAGADVPARLNVNDLYSKGGPQWDVYIRALRSLQDKDESDPLSYFQVAGIHGLPYIEWENGGPLRADGWRGYCPHGESLFLPWHRPYVLLFEQVLVAEAQKIAATYPESVRSQYVDAANTLRAPFWDWSRDSNVPPCSVPATLTVNIPDGENLTTTRIKNPLQTYTYPRKARSGQFGPFTRSPTTSRCPAPNSYPYTANRRLGQLGLKQETYDAFTYSRTFNQFANSREDGIGLEQIHNSIHFYAGCGGQFLDSNVAAFDGLFMLHHSHVDRLWAYYNFINPSEAVFGYSYYGQSRYSSPQNTVITPNSPLQPFYDDKDTYWTSAKVASIKGMGYTYEGLEYWKKSPEELRSDSMKIINSLYAPVDDDGFFKRSTGQAKTRYFARVELEREHIERPSTVDIFVNGKPAGKVVVMQLPEAGTLQGRVAVDAEVHSAFAANPATNGTVSSIEHLVEVEIRRPDGSVIPVNTVPSLKLTLEEVAVMPARSNSEFPKPGSKNKVAASLRDRYGKASS